MNIQTPSRVELGLNGNCVVGWIHSYDPALGLVCVELEESNTLTPEMDQEIRMTLPDQSTLHSTVLEVQDQQWIVSLPVSLSPAQQRKHVRHSANGAWHFDFDQSTLELHDISKEGLGLILSPDHPFLHAGWSKKGTLRYLEDTSWTITVVATNLHAHPYHDGWSILGCKIELLDGSSKLFLTSISSQV